MLALFALEEDLQLTLSIYPELEVLKVLKITMLQLTCPSKKQVTERQVSLIWSEHPDCSRGKCIETSNTASMDNIIFTTHCWQTNWKWKLWFVSIFQTLNQIGAVYKGMLGKETVAIKEIKALDSMEFDKLVEEAAVMRFGRS